MNLTLNETGTDPFTDPFTDYKTYKANDIFDMWLMFTPSGGHAVPLQKVHWYWSGTGVLSGSSWNLLDSDNNQDPSGNDTFDYPSWTNKLSNFTMLPE